MTVWEADSMLAICRLKSPEEEKHLALVGGITGDL